MNSKICEKTITIMFYTNCQSAGIIPNIKLNIKNIIIHQILNYQHIQNNLPLPINILNNCDIFIYQPIDKKHGIYSTDNNDNIQNIISFLPNNCLKISFPYIYNSGIWGITKDAIKNDDGTTQGNRDVIIKLKNSKSLEDIIKMYYNNEIDFKYKERFESSIQKLEKKEIKCDIYISDFIKNNILKQKLFFTQSHPTPFLFKYVSRKILDIIKINYIDYFVNTITYLYVDTNCLCDGAKWPISKSDILYWKFEYTNIPDDDADNYYIDLITRYYNLQSNQNEGDPDVYY
jgi:hypothetical protein